MVHGAVGRPWPVTIATIGVASMVVGLAMWTVSVIADVVRLQDEAESLADRFDGSEGVTFYSLYSVCCIAIFIGLAALTTAVTVRLIGRGGRSSLAVTCVLLATTVILVGLPSSFFAVVTALSGGSRGPVTADMSFDDALTVVHTANTPGWSVGTTVLGSILVVVGGLSAGVLFLTPSSRRYFAHRRSGIPSAGGGQLARAGPID